MAHDIKRDFDLIPHWVKIAQSMFGHRAQLVVSLVSDPPFRLEVSSVDNPGLYFRQPPATVLARGWSWLSVFTRAQAKMNRQDKKRKKHAARAG